MWLGIYTSLREGEFHFEGALNLERFLQTAQDLGLYAIVRPSPFICAGWEFDVVYQLGFLTKDMRLRSSDPAYVKLSVAIMTSSCHGWFHICWTMVATSLMMQVEMRYGSMEKIRLI